MLYSKTQWREALEKSAPVYYFYSSDPFLARTAAEKTLAELAAATDGEVTVLDGPAPGVEEMVTAAGTISFLAPGASFHCRTSSPPLMVKRTWKKCAT